MNYSIFFDGKHEIGKKLFLEGWREVTFSDVVNTVHAVKIVDGKKESGLWEVVFDTDFEGYGVGYDLERI